MEDITEFITEFTKALHWILEGAPYIAIISLLVIYKITRAQATR